MHNIIMKHLSNIAVVFGQGFCGGDNTLLSSFQILVQLKLDSVPGDLILWRESWDDLVQPASRVHSLLLERIEHR